MAAMQDEEKQLKGVVYYGIADGVYTLFLVIEELDSKFQSFKLEVEKKRDSLLEDQKEVISEVSYSSASKCFGTPSTSSSI